MGPLTLNRWAESTGARERREQMQGNAESKGRGSKEGRTRSGEEKNVHCGIPVSD